MVVEALPRSSTWSLAVAPACNSCAGELTVTKNAATQHPHDLQRASALGHLAIILQCRSSMTYAVVVTGLAACSTTVAGEPAMLHCNTGGSTIRPELHCHGRPITVAVAARCRTAPVAESDAPSRHRQPHVEAPSQHKPPTLTALGTGSCTRFSITTLADTHESSIAAQTTRARSTRWPTTQCG